MLRVVLAAAVALLPLCAAAQTAWPKARPIRIIDPSQAGSSTDIVARMIANQLGQRRGKLSRRKQPGAGTTIGVQQPGAPVTDTRFSRFAGRARM
jgi:tripartite-type tricarboxylate transporter receptor subunit TctC